jgi:hypothetical protein
MQGSDTRIPRGIISPSTFPDVFAFAYFEGPSSMAKLSVPVHIIRT